MRDLDYLKSLPKVEVSFQDDFSGSERELFLTPNYVLRELAKQQIMPRLGQKILFWEKDTDFNGIEDYMCNVGVIVKATKDILEKHEGYGHQVSNKDLVMLQDTPIMVKIERESASYFRLPINSKVLK